MLALGVLFGFVGLGGTGLVAAALILLFHVPVHLAFATGLGALCGTALFGGWSHLREGNVDPVVAVQIGLAGVVGAYLGGGFALATGAFELKTMTGLVLMSNSVLIYGRTRLAPRWKPETKRLPLSQRWGNELVGSSAVGLICGFISGFFSIGSAPWIQVGLLVVKRTDLRRTIGTAMFSMALMSFSGAVRFAQGGQISPGLLASVLAGVSAGSFLGAKLTRRAPRGLVRGAMVATPLLAGSLLLLAPVVR